MAKQIKRKTNALETKRKVKEDLKRRISYMIKGKNTIEFTAPEEHNMNRMLGHNKPLASVDQTGHFMLDGEMGFVRKFYIPTKEYEQLQILYKEFDLPADTHADLTWAYLNMIFAICEATYTTNFYKEHEWDQKELLEILNFLESLWQGNIDLGSISLEYSNKPNKEIDKKHRSSTHVIKAKGGISVLFLQEVLLSFKGSKNYEMLRQFADASNADDRLPQFMGHKNAETHSSSYYAKMIFDYLDRHLFRGAFQYMSEPQKHLRELKQLTQKYSRQQMFLFIGKIMLLSGLLIMKDEPLNEEIIDNIEKKVEPKFVSKNLE